MKKGITNTDFGTTNTFSQISEFSNIKVTNHKDYLAKFYKVVALS